MYAADTGQRFIFVSYSHKVRNKQHGFSMLHGVRSGPQNLLNPRVKQTIRNQISSQMTSQIPFDSPHIDWDSQDLYQEFSRFSNHVGFVFDGPLCKLKAEEKAGWLGTWMGPQGREIYKTLQWGEGEQKDPGKVLDKLEAYVRPRKN